MKGYVGRGTSNNPLKIPSFVLCWVGGFEQCKFMVFFKDFPYNSELDKIMTPFESRIVRWEMFYLSNHVKIFVKQSNNCSIGVLLISRTYYLVCLWFVQPNNLLTNYIQKKNTSDTVGPPKMCCFGAEFLHLPKTHMESDLEIEVLPKKGLLFWKSSFFRVLSQEILGSNKNMWHFDFSFKTDIFLNKNCIFSGWCLQLFSIFTPILGNDPFWRAYSSNGWEQPPTSFSLTLILFQLEVKTVIPVKTWHNPMDFAYTTTLYTLGVFPSPCNSGK